ncbi:hypothetical protein [Embleya hyalina]|uniref:Transposase n=1 Tax=Embleya hyalina TaxID=516124 RepID=A0A401YIE4_9ACTN|nr:hypothetical protein [Embleya hyalina]GCD94370.1 hypothetical protein EHYA_02031 [Embleya hyalina]
MVNTSVFRLSAIGVTDADGRTDEAAWFRWQVDKRDSRQKQLYRLVLALGEAYQLVGEHPKHKRRSLVTVEHMRECIAEIDPATGEVPAFLEICTTRSGRRSGRRSSLTVGACSYRRSQAERTFGFIARSWDDSVWIAHDGSAAGGRPPLPDGPA